MSYLACIHVAICSHIELQKFIGALFFAWDLKMYLEVRRRLFQEFVCQFVACIRVLNSL